MVTPNHKLFSLLLHNLATARNSHVVNTCVSWWSWESQVGKHYSRGRTLLKAEGFSLLPCAFIPEHQETGTTAAENPWLTGVAAELNKHTKEKGETMRHCTLGVTSQFLLWQKPSLCKNKIPSSVTVAFYLQRNLPRLNKNSNSYIHFFFVLIEKVYLGSQSMMAAGGWGLTSWTTSSKHREWTESGSSV